MRYELSLKPVSIIHSTDQSLNEET